MISLRSSHIYLSKQLVEKVFDQVHYAYVKYLLEQQQLLITPVTSLWFTKMYSPVQFLLKSRNLKGDKTLAIREILVDNNLNDSDRNLDYKLIEKTNLIKVII